MSDNQGTAELLGLVNHQAEITVLSAMRQDVTVGVELAEALTPMDFYDPRRAVVFESIRNLLRGVDSVDTPAIVAESRRLCVEQRRKFQITPDYVDSFAVAFQRIDPHANTVKRLAWLRGASDFATWLVTTLQSRPDPADLFAEAQEMWQALQPLAANSGFVYGWDTIKLHNDIIRERMAEAKEGTVLRFDWPWQSWNRIIRPLRPGMVGTFAAPDGMGKSAYLELVAEHWAQSGHHVVLVHLEDALDYKLDRRLARHASIPIDAIEDGTLTDAQRQAALDAQRRISEWGGRLHYFHAPGKSMVEIVRELESRRAEGICDAVVFDYLDKVQPTRAQVGLFGGNTWERQAHDMEQLKTFAERAGVPVFTATQGNKEMQGEGLRTRKAIQGSGQKSQKSQLVVILTRDIVGNEGLTDVNGARIAEPGEYSPIAKIRIDKQNRGKTGQLEQVFVGKFFNVRDMQI